MPYYYTSPGDYNGERNYTPLYESFDGGYFYGPSYVITDELDPSGPTASIQFGADVWIAARFYTWNRPENVGVPGPDVIAAFGTLSTHTLSTATYPDQMPVGPITFMTYVGGQPFGFDSATFSLYTGNAADWGSGTANANHGKATLLARDGSDITVLTDSGDGASWSWVAGDYPTGYGIRLEHTSPGIGNPVVLGCTGGDFDGMWLSPLLRQRQSPRRSPSRVGWF